MRLACGRDAVLLQHQYDLHGATVRFSVFDNLLLAHHIRSGHVQIIDVEAGASSVMSAPQPLSISALGVCSNWNPGHMICRACLQLPWDCVESCGTRL
jgi:hypothetical protein